MYTIIPQSASIALSDLPFEFAKFLECQSKAHSYAFYVYNPSTFPAPASHKKNGPDGRPDKITNIFFKINTFLPNVSDSRLRILPLKEKSFFILPV